MTSFSSGSFTVANQMIYSLLANSLSSSNKQVRSHNRKIPRRVAVSGKLCHYTAGPNCATGQYVHSNHYPLNYLIFHCRLCKQKVELKISFLDLDGGMIIEHYSSKAMPVVDDQPSYENCLASTCRFQLLFSSQVHSACSSPHGIC